MNGYQFFGDVIHLFAFFLLIGNIIIKRSCSTVSGKTQVLLAVTFLARYSDLLTSYISPYNTSLKILFISAALATNYLIHFQFRIKYDGNHDKIRLECLLIMPAFLAIIFTNCTIALTTDSLLEVLWTFSIFLEAIAILPQLYLVLKKGEAEFIIAYYVTALTIYRSLYIINWYYRYIYEDHIDMISVAGGVVQVIIYAMFFLLPVSYKRAIKEGTEGVFTVSNEISKQRLPYSFYKDIALITPLTTQTEDKIVC